MASLNTLRTKGGVFLTIVIAIALLAFVLSDLNSCQGNQNPTVAEINGNKVKWSDFDNERQAQEVLYKENGNTDSYEMSYQRAWQNLVMDLSYVPGFGRLGLTVTEDEQVDMVSGAFISPVIAANFPNPQTGQFDPQQLNYFISNMYSDMQLYWWNYIKGQMVDERQVSKYLALAGSAVTVNDIELGAGLAADNNVYSARVITKPYSSIPDSTVSVTAAEIKNYYEQHKAKYKQDASRDIEYVAFDIVPSTEDMDAAREYIDGLATEFAAAADPVRFAMANSPDDKSAPVFVKESDLDTEMAEAFAANSGAVYGPELDGETYTVSRLAESRMMPESVEFSYIVLAKSDAKRADSIYNAIKAGGDFAALAREHSIDQSTAQTGGEAGSADPASFLNQMPEMGEGLIRTAKGEIFRADLSNGSYVVKVTDKGESVRKVKVAALKYVVRPSLATQTSIINSADEFYAKAKGSYDDFKKAANEAGVSKRVARIRDTDRNISGLDNSLRLVRWAFSNKKGTVSSPEEIGNNRIVVAAVTGVAEKGTSALEEVSDDIRTLLVQRKKGDMLAAEMQGTSLSEVASKLGLTEVDADNVQFSTFFLPEFGFEPRLVGAITAAESAGKLSKPVKGSAGVYLFEVTSIDKTQNVSETDEKAKLDAAAGMYTNERVQQAIYEMSNVKDYRVRYF